MIIGLSGPNTKQQDNTRRVFFPAKISSTRRFSHAGSFKNEDNETDTSEDSKDENHLHAHNEDQGEDDGGGSLAGSDVQRNDRDNQDQDIAIELFDDVEDDMGDDEDHDQDQDNEEALLLNEIDAFNEAHKNDLEATEAMEMELEEALAFEMDYMINEDRMEQQRQASFEDKG